MIGLCAPGAEEHGIAGVGTRLRKGYHAEIMVKQEKGGTVGEVQIVVSTPFTGHPPRRASFLEVNQSMVAIALLHIGGLFTVIDVVTIRQVVAFVG